MMNRSSPLLTYATVSCFAVVACAAAWLEKNDTTLSSNGDHDGVSVPFPGSAWLERMASTSSSYEWNNRTFTSAYDAILDGSPLAHPCRNFNAYVNSFFLSPSVAAFLIDWTGSLSASHYILCYIRNVACGMLEYYSVSFLFHYHCYMHPRTTELFAHRTRPTWDTILDQIKMAQMSIPLYVLLPLMAEIVIEQGWTSVYYHVDDIGGWVPCILYTLVYFVLVEIGIYWMHRTLHTNKFLYKHVHQMHHKYNRADTLTPWASIAFHPLDGMLQAFPYVAVLTIVPCHYMAHMCFFFLTCIWSTYIHDALDWNVHPIMGSKYHTVHHTHYIYNYGQVFIFCDQFWGTFKEPDGPTGVKNGSKTKRTLQPTSRMSNKNKLQ